MPVGQVINNDACPAAAEPPPRGWRDRAWEVGHRAHLERSSGVGDGSLTYLPSSSFRS
jgi:hypothetical protein